MEKLIEQIDYYIDKNGLFVFTKKYHLDRGYCCGNGCKHCPWKDDLKTDEQPETKPSLE